MRQFVPMTDELLYESGLPGPLVPYRCGVPCWHRLQDAEDTAASPGGGWRADDPAVNASRSTDRPA